VVKNHVSKARKNKWEREKLKKDPSYHKKRLDQKARWRKDHNADKYQKVYRQNHPDYVKDNREGQQLRNKSVQGVYNRATGKAPGSSDNQSAHT
jgi:hypothetical protein